jgi:hypothetical protein
VEAIVMVSMTIRKAISSDRAAILQLVPRLRAFGTPPFHEPPDLDAASAGQSTAISMLDRKAHNCGSLSIPLELLQALPMRKG